MDSKYSSLKLEKPLEIKTELKPEWVSDCCGAKARDLDIPICYECGEHCEYVNLNEE